MLKIDVDDYPEMTRFELQKIMYAMPRPFFVRLSSGRTGLHLAVPLCKKWDCRRIMYDDPMRIELDLQREHKKLRCSNLLWDVKEGKAADRWRFIRNSKNIEIFLDSIETKAIYTHLASRVLTRKQKTS